MKKNKFLVSGLGLDVLKKFGKYPCDVCHSGVGNTESCGSTRGAAASIDSRPKLRLPEVQRQGWAHRQQTGDSGRCRQLHAWCGGHVLLCVGTRCCVTWRKFWKLLPVLTTRHLSHKVRGEVYNGYICSIMLHGSKTWGPSTSNL